MSHKTYDNMKRKVVAFIAIFNSPTPTFNAQLFTFIPTDKCPCGGRKYKVIVEMLQNINCSNRNFTTLLCDCRCLMARIWQVWVGLVFRETNKCVDLLAKEGLFFDGKFCCV